MSCSADPRSAAEQISVVACYEYPTYLVFSFGRDFKSIAHSCPVLAASAANTTVRGCEVSDSEAAAAAAANTAVRVYEVSEAFVYT